MKEQSLFVTTALLYFRDALDRQSFEACKELLSVARENGAKQEQIQEVIVDFLRGDNFGGNGAERQENRLRYIKTKGGK